MSKICFRYRAQVNGGRQRLGRAIPSAFITSDARLARLGASWSHKCLVCFTYGVPCCSGVPDVVERFQLFCFLAVIAIQNLSHIGIDYANAWLSGAVPYSCSVHCGYTSSLVRSHI